jgi:hypothetical protein
MGACVDPAILPGAVGVVFDRAPISRCMEEVTGLANEGRAVRAIVNTLRTGPPRWLQSLIDPDIMYLITVVMVGVVLAILTFGLNR